MSKERFYKVDLTPCYNKRMVFPREEITEDMGNDGVGIDKRTFFDFNKTIELDGVEYIFRQSNSMDCIICNNQNILLPPTAFHKLHILGFMFWGANSDYLKLNYVNGKNENAKVFFNDWSAAYNILDINFFDTPVEKGFKTVETFFSCGKLKIPLYLHHCEYDNPANEKLESITLPDNMHMFILAMTLEGR